MSVWLSTKAYLNVLADGFIWLILISFVMKYSIRNTMVMFKLSSLSIVDSWWEWTCGYSADCLCWQDVPLRRYKINMCYLKSQTQVVACWNSPQCKILFSDHWRGFTEMEKLIDISWSYQQYCRSITFSTEYVYLCPCVCIYIYTHIIYILYILYTCTYIYIYIHIYLWKCVYICIYAYICARICKYFSLLR